MRPAKLAEPIPATMKMFLPRLVAAVLAVLAASGSAFAQQGTSASSPPILPDPKMTPGDTLDVTLADIQEHGYSAKVRNVPVAVKREVYNAYGIQHWEKGEYEIDHLIALSLGGSNSKKNLWPQSYKTSPWNAHTKDQLEVKLLKLVRDGKVDLHEAQQAMAKDWIAAYKKYVSPTPIAHKVKPKAKKDAAELANAEKDEDPDTDSAPTITSTKTVKVAPPAVDPSSAPGGITSAAASPAADAEHAGQVWVNTKSGVIWKPGSRYFGKTKEGKYMTPEEAAKAGYHEAK